MKNDQIARSVASLAVALAYSANLAFNGHSPVSVPGLASGVSPFGLTLLVLLILAFPELLHSFPLGPSRKED